MSTKIELRFRNADENDVIPVLLSPDSGFREDPLADEFRKPLKWGPGETLSLAGVIVGVAQLAVSMYEVFRKAPGATVELRGLEPAREPIVIEGKDGTPDEIARRINEAIGHDRV